MAQQTTQAAAALDAAQPADLRRRIAALEARLAESVAELAEARAQQAATAEVLQVINSSPGDLARVFDAMLEKAMALCEAAFGGLWTFDCDRYVAVALRGVPPAYASFLASADMSPGPGTAPYRLRQGERIVHNLDLADEEAYRAGDPQRRALVDLGGARSALQVSLRKDGDVLGVITVYRQEVRPFTDKQIALLENFAAQAVIAMENARLLRELQQRTADLQESLEYQTATGDVLNVINRSAFDLETVLQTVATTALRLCRADSATIYRNEDGEYRWAAGHMLVPEYEELERNARIRPGMGTVIGRCVLAGGTVQILDAGTDPLYEAKNDARIGGVHTMIGVPLLRDGAPIGAIGLARRRIEAFSEREIQLVSTFADQAAIAIENARLLTETREALEQQTATAAVLQVINSSPGDLAPVFDAILEKALSLCEGAFGSLARFDSDAFDWVATRGVPEAWFAEFAASGYRPTPGLALYRFQHDGEDIEHVVDIAADETGRSATPDRRRFTELTGARTAIWIALRKDRALRGALVIYRREVRPFTDKQIALLQNFAAQAVIAMENARLLTETREALEQQTATAEVLQVINSSPGDLAPVFDAMLEKAMRLCEAAYGHFVQYDGEFFNRLAIRGKPEIADWQRRRGPLRGDASVTFLRLLGGEAFVHMPDLVETDAYRDGSPAAVALVDLGGCRTLLSVALRKENSFLGVVSLYREGVRPFTDKQIALLQNFAAQAVIAMENARLITETREALEQQTATAEVLQVINSSPGDLAPVFEAILEKAHGLCGIALGALHVNENGKFRAAAVRGVTGGLAELLRQPLDPPPGSPAARLLGGQPIVQIPDMAEFAKRHPDDPRAQACAEDGLHTVLFVPLRKDEHLLGHVAAFRQEVRPFTDKQIALLQNFAAQAVIAMENARLLTETREALEQQTATAEVLQVINSSPGDLAPVFDAMLDKALILCDASFGQLVTFDGTRFRAAAWRGYAPDHGQGTTARPGMALYDLIEGAKVVHIPDITADDVYRSGNAVRRRLADEYRARTAIWVALKKEEALLGAFVIYRTEVRPFTDKQIALLQNFAAQAVIAMENARLIDEIRQRQAELRVTFDNMGDGVVMFDQDLRLTAWNRNFQEMLDLPDAVLASRPSYAEYLRILAERGEFGSDDIEGELSRRLAETEEELRLERTRPDGRVIEVRRNAVPGGGFVLIYSDITERKEAEVRLRAARDSAEGALRELRAAQANLIHAEKMASLGQLTAGIAHEIKNPLNFVNNFAGLSVELLDELKEAAAPAVASLGEGERAEIDELVATLSGNLDRIAEHGRRADGIVTSMLAHSRGGSGERRQVDLNALVDEALNLAYHGARARDQSFEIELERDFDSTAQPIELVPQDMTRVLLNLIGNGFYAAAAKRRTVQNKPAVLKVTTCDLGETVEIRVRDNGAGIPPEIRGKLFQPFFTTKPTGEGTGLGLSISWDIVTQQHGGTIEVDSRLREFTEFTVRLPRTEPNRSRA